MKKILIAVMILASLPALAQANFSASLIRGGTFISIEVSDDHLIPPFEAGELWKIMKGQELMKIMREKELSITCNAFKNQSDDMVGTCSLLMPYSQFQKIGKLMVFKGKGQVAARLNRAFIDSAYYSIQSNQVYLSSYNTRRLFYFGINEDLIQK